MEERKKQILLEKLTEYNKTVNNISKFQLNKREENLFCEIMQQFADEYHSEQLHQYNVSGQREQLVKFSHYIQKHKNEGLDFDCVEREVDAYLTNCH